VVTDGATHYEIQPNATVTPQRDPGLLGPASIVEHSGHAAVALDHFKGSSNG
jgi:hypothetical protein